MSEFGTKVATDLPGMVPIRSKRRRAITIAVFGLFVLLDLVFVLLLVVYSVLRPDDRAIHGTWTIIAPNDYTGTMIVYFNCPGGHPLLEDGAIRSNFSSQGTDCVRDTFHGWAGDYVASRTNGNELLIDLDTVPANTDALNPGGIEGSTDNSGNSLDFADFYVGPGSCANDLNQGKPLPKSCHYQEPFAFATQHKPSH